MTKFPANTITAWSFVNPWHRDIFNLHLQRYVSECCLYWRDYYNTGPHLYLYITSYLQTDSGRLIWINTSEDGSRQAINSKLRTAGLDPAGLIEVTQ